MSGFIVVVVLLGLAWLFIVLPVRRRQRAASSRTRRCRTPSSSGDEIITAGGMYAVVSEIDDDRLKIEIAPGVIVSLDRRAVAAVAEDEEVEAEDDEAQAGEPAARERQRTPLTCPRLTSRRSHFFLIFLILLALAGVALTRGARARRSTSRCGKASTSRVASRSC